jgi:hypothetical protein
LQPKFCMQSEAIQKNASTRRLPDRPQTIV